jgi:hypothetical protein
MPGCIFAHPDGRETAIADNWNQQAPIAYAGADWYAGGAYGTGGYGAAGGGSAGDGSTSDSGSGGGLGGKENKLYKTQLCKQVGSGHTTDVGTLIRTIGP